MVPLEQTIGAIPNGTEVAEAQCRPDTVAAGYLTANRTCTVRQETRRSSAAWGRPRTARWRNQRCLGVGRRTLRRPYTVGTTTRRFAVMRAAIRLQISPRV